MENNEDTDTILIKFLNQECGKVMSYGPIKITISYPSDDYEEEDEKKLVKKMCTKCNCTVYVDENEENLLESPVPSISRNQEEHMYPPNDGKFSGSGGIPKRCVICQKKDDENACLDCVEKETKSNSWSNDVEYDNKNIKKCIHCDQLSENENACSECKTNKKGNSWSNTGYEEYNIKRCFLCNHPTNVPNEDMCSDCRERENMKNSEKNYEISQYEAIRGVSDVENTEKDDQDHLLGTSLEDFEYLEKKYAIEDKTHSPPEVTMDVIKEKDDSPPPHEVTIVKTDSLIPNSSISAEDREPSTLNLSFIEETHLNAPKLSGENNLQKQNASINLVDSCEWKGETKKTKIDSSSVKSLELGLSFDSNPDLKDEQTQKPSLSDVELQKFPKNESILKELLKSGYLICSCDNCEPDKYKNLKVLYENACAGKIDEIKNMKFDMECSKCELKNYTDDDLNEHVKKIEDMLPKCECSKKQDEPAEIKKPHFYV